MIFAYFQGGPKDLHKQVIVQPRPPSRILVAVVQDNPILTSTPSLTQEEKDRLQEVEKHVYEIVGGYTRAGIESVTYAYAGPSSQIITGA